MPLGCVVFLAEELLKLFLKNKKKRRICIYIQQHKQHNPTTLRVATTQPHDEEKIKLNIPLPLGCVVFPTEELLKLFLKNKKNEGFVFIYNNTNNIIQQHCVWQQHSHTTRRK